LNRQVVCDYQVTGYTAVYIQIAESWLVNSRKKSEASALG